MKRKQYIDKLFKELTLEQISFIGFNIYHNPIYIDYYKDYNTGRYDKCYEFIKTNIHLLDVKYTPIEYKDLRRG